VGVGTRAGPARIRAPVGGRAGGGAYRGADRRRRAGPVAGRAIWSRAVAAGGDVQLIYGAAASDPVRVLLTGSDGAVELLAAQTGAVLAAGRLGSLRLPGDGGSNDINGTQVRAAQVTVVEGRVLRSSVRADGLPVRNGRADRGGPGDRCGGLAYPHRLVVRPETRQSGSFWFATLDLSHGTPTLLGSLPWVVFQNCHTADDLLACHTLRHTVQIWRYRT
jgi:hypothetical protein